MKIPVEYMNDPEMMDYPIVRAGTIPIGGDYEIEEAPERLVYESFQEGVERYVSYKDKNVRAPAPAAKKRGRPRKSD